MGSENQSSQDLLLTASRPQETQAGGEKHEQLPEMVTYKWDNGEEAVVSSLETAKTS